MEWNRGGSPEDTAAIEHFAPEQNGCEKIEKRAEVLLQKAYICSFGLHKIKLIVSENDL